VDSEIGVIGKVNPPLRTSNDCEALWKAMGEGQIDVVGSDHVPRQKAFKEGGIWKASPGCPGLETLLPVLISEGHIKRGIPLQKIANTVSSNPARIFGLSHRKGAIGVGMDADLVVVDLNAKWKLEEDDVMSNAGYSIYEGWDINCNIVHTITRGRFAKREGKVQKLSGNSEYCARPYLNKSKEEL
jgi:dihydroorotase-like cyclic amidohydrolase